jgi:hypothetical protein
MSRRRKQLLIVMIRTSWTRRQRNQPFFSDFLTLGISRSGSPMAAAAVGCMLS